MRRALHLIRRFFTSLWPAGPGPDDDAWALTHLSGPEQALWQRMSGQDRRHAVRVARAVEDEHGDDRAVMAAALLHDVGKTVADLGTYGRVVATLSVAVAGEDTARLWARSRGVTRRVGLYVDYPRLGVDLLELAGSDPMVVAWSAEHHRPESEWTVDPVVGRRLAAADDAG